MADTQTLEGRLASVQIRGADLWGTAMLVPDAGPNVKLAGKLPGVREGDTVKVVGFWATHPRYGPEFRLHDITAVDAKSTGGVVAWLVSRLPKIGRKRARELVERFGVEGIWTVLEETPDRLLEVKGIGSRARDEIVDAYHRHREERDLIVQFKEWGLTDHQIGLVTEAWGANAEARIRKNAYDLIEEVKGFGFARADAVAQSLGVKPRDPFRIRAGILTVLRVEHKRGHTYVPAPVLLAKAAGLLGIDAKSPELWPAAFALSDAGRLVGGGHRARLPEVYEAERGVARGVLRLLRGAAA
ncbi:MAG: helix-hairpin-helix domain-containing protein [Myxococcota bacterium]